MTFKKLLALCLVTLSVSSISAKAMDQRPEEALAQKINTFLTESTQKEVQPETSSYWTSSLSYLGNSLRYVGDCCRTNNSNEAKDLLKKEAQNQLLSQIGDNQGGQILKKLIADESTVTSGWNGLGNGLRWMGACFVEESKTPERLIRDFFKQRAYQSYKTPDLLKVTACALFMSNLKDTDLITNIFIQFVSLINNSSTFTHIDDKNTVFDSFIKGFIRYVTLTNNQKFLPVFNQNLTVNLEASKEILFHVCNSISTFGINFLEFDCVKDITIEKLVADKKTREEMSKKDTDLLIVGARINAVNNYLSSIFSSEYAKLNLNHDLFFNNEVKLLEPSKVEVKAIELVEDIEEKKNDVLLIEGPKAEDNKQDGQEEEVKNLENNQEKKEDK